VIAIDSDISSWENTTADIELRAGDILLIPKRPNFVDVSGAVYNPVAISYIPGKDLDWYLKKAGGATRTGDRKNIYVLRADGSVVVPEDRHTIWMKAGFGSIRMHPGDTIIIPEKIVGASQVWQSIMGTASIASSVASPLAFAGVL
jgi:protein involved in polysaccharide export with SLBB domain